MFSQFKNSLGAPQKVTRDIPKRPGSSTPRYGTNEGNCPRRDVCRIRHKSPEVETNVDEVREKLPVLRPHDGVLPGCNRLALATEQRNLKDTPGGRTDMKARAAGLHVHGTSGTGERGDRTHMGWLSGAGGGAGRLLSGKPRPDVDHKDL